MNVKHILLIDDNEMDNHITNYILSKNGFLEKISICYSAIDALELLEEMQVNNEAFPEIIFLDIRMPSMDGFEFLGVFSQLPESIISQTSIYILSSSDEYNDKQRAAQFPMVKKFLTKPFSQQLLNEIQNEQNTT